MALAAGSRLGPYEVLAPLGAGGMGEVYRAKDPRLDRDVAVKVLPGGFLEGEEGRGRRERFEREARILASLNHPGIAAIYSFEEIPGPSPSSSARHILTMELLEGEPLREVLRVGPLPLRKVLDLGAQIADGLAAAHEKGIVHRDVKPENVFVTRDGRAKLLDFGLARTYVSRDDPSLTRSPTISSLSSPGSVAGTVAYMSPEQASGKPVDFRSDQFSLGIVLYEMLAGLRPFRADSAAETMTAIIREEPEPLDKVATGTPAPVRWLVERCLAKDPSDRYDSTRDLAREIATWRLHVSEASLATPDGRSAKAEAAPRTRRFRAAAGLALVLAIGAAAVIFGRRLFVPALPPRPVVRSLLDVAPADQVGSYDVAQRTPGGRLTALAWTRDGRALVFVGERAGVRRLYVRALEDREARPLEGTEGAEAPALSPDGRWVAFLASGSIRRVALSGGPVAELVEKVAPLRGGVSWGDDGRIYFDVASSGDGSLRSVSPAIWSALPGQTAAALTKRLEGEVAHVLPHALPGARAVLFTARHQGAGAWGDEEVVAHVLGTGERKALVRDGADARYVPPGYLVFLRRGTLFGVGFDLARLEVRGTAVPILEQVTQALTSSNTQNMTGAGHFSVSPDGALAYVAGPVVPYREADLVAVDREGRTRATGAPRRSYSSPLALSPDGGRLAVGSPALTGPSLWVYDLASGKSNKLPGTGARFWPRWTPDGERLSFDWLSAGVSRFAWQRADGATGPEALSPRDWLASSSWSPDGRHLALVKDDDIWIATLDGGTLTTARFLETPEAENWPEFSPDGKWLAYGADARARTEVYVQAFPGPGPRHLVSVESGMSPAWSPTGREIFFLAGPREGGGTFRMMAADVRLGPTFRSGKPRQLFTFSDQELRFPCVPLRCYAVAPDGGTFYAVRPVPAAPPTPVTKIHLVQNFVEELKARVTAAN